MAVQPHLQRNSQGGILSPLLANIYLNELDAYIEDVLIPQYTRGKRRASNLEYCQLGIRHPNMRGKQATQEQFNELEQQRRNNAVSKCE